MVDICEGASATGEDAFHPGESILAAGNSFQELGDDDELQATDSVAGFDRNPDDSDMERDNVEGSDNEVRLCSLDLP